jgi:hypothetical protein
MEMKCRVRLRDWRNGGKGNFSKFVTKALHNRHLARVNLFFSVLFAQGFSSPALFRTCRCLPDIENDK